MSPSELSWTQGFVLLFLGALISVLISWYFACRYRTHQGEREVDLESGRESGIPTGTDDTRTDPFEGEPPSELSAPLRGGDDERRSPSNHAPPAILFTVLPCRSQERKPCGRKRLRSNFRTLKLPSMKKSRYMDVVPQTEPRILRRSRRRSRRRRERASDVVADPATPWLSSTPAGLSRPPRRCFVRTRSLPHHEGIPLVDHLEAETSQGLRHRHWTGPAEVMPDIFSYEDIPIQQHAPEAKRFNGVRYRHERRTWSAEMKPPMHKNKVYFGQAKSPTEAARMVDAAYHYYGKPRFLNFPDETPGMLSSRVIPAGLDEEDKLKFVKAQAKWLAAVASALSPSTRKEALHQEVTMKEV